MFCPRFTILALSVLLLNLRSCRSAAGADDGILDLTILHTNDMHARFAETDAFGNECSESDAKANKCVGGFARIMHILREYRRQPKPVLFLNAGDTFTGTTWFTINRDRIVGEFMNMLKPDAACLGNHEFDYGVNGLVPFLRLATFPIVAANLNLTLEPLLLNERCLRRSTVVRVKDHRIGIIGYLTPDTKQLGPPNGVGISDEVAAVNAEAEVLRSTGVRTIIALGHSGLSTDRRIAAQCPLVDLVVGGHNDVFMWNGAGPNSRPERPYCAYPLVVTQPGAAGKRVPVVQAYAFTKYMGVLNVSIARNGSVVAFAGQPVLLDAAVPQDAEALRLLEQYRPSVVGMQEAHVGRSAVLLNGTCRTEESNVGNLVCDALVHSHVRAFHAAEDVRMEAMRANGTVPVRDTGRWVDGAVAFYNSGGIMQIGQLGQLTLSDLMLLLPYDSSFVSVWLNGTEIRQLLELSVARYANNCQRNEFLQMSGARVVYDVSQPPGRRVHTVEMLCTECEQLRYEPLLPERRYMVLVNDYLSRGGDGYGMLLNRVYEHQADNVVTALQKYITHREVVYPMVEGRIRFIGARGAADGGQAGTEHASAESAATIVSAVCGTIWLTLGVLVISNRA